jgi:hypothetical protein
MAALAGGCDARGTVTDPVDEEVPDGDVELLFEHAIAAAAIGTSASLIPFRSIIAQFHPGTHVPAVYDPSRMAMGCRDSVDADAACWDVLRGERAPREYRTSREQSMLNR